MCVCLFRGQRSVRYGVHTWGLSTGEDQKFNANFIYMVGQSQYVIYMRLCQKQSCRQPSINQSINWSIKMRVREGGRIVFCPAGDHNNNLMHGRQILRCWAGRIILFLRPCFILAPFPFIKVLIDAIANKHTSVSDALKPGVRNRRSCVRRPGEWHHLQTAI